MVRASVSWRGRLRIGEAMGPPLMRAVKKRLAPLQEQENADAIIDAPPGVSCPAINAVMDSDVIVLVTEPTPFGFHDFKLAWEAFAPIGKPMGVVINRAGIGDHTVQDFCREKNLPILAEIPFQRTVAEGYSKGQIIATLNDELRFGILYDSRQNPDGTCRQGGPQCVRSLSSAAKGARGRQP